MESKADHACAGAERLVFACSGAADVGALSDRAARKLSRDGTAKMLCIAAIGAGIEEMIAKARAADVCLAIDGCEKRCAEKCMQRAGVDGVTAFNLVEHLGMEKGKTPVNRERTMAVVGKAESLLPA